MCSIFCADVLVRSHLCTETKYWVRTQSWVFRTVLASNFYFEQKNSFRRGVSHTVTEMGWGMEDRRNFLVWKLHAEMPSKQSFMGPKHRNCGFFVFEQVLFSRKWLNGFKQLTKSVQTRFNKQHLNGNAFHLSIGYCRCRKRNFSLPIMATSPFVPLGTLEICYFMNLKVTVQLWR